MTEETTGIDRNMDRFWSSYLDRQMTWEERQEIASERAAEQER